MALRVVVNGDVTNMDVDAVVNAANEQREAVSAERSLQRQMTLGLQKTAGSWPRVRQAVQ